MSSGPPTMRLRAAARASALAVTTLALAASIDGPRCQVPDRDSATFDAATSCGPSRVVTLRTELVNPAGRDCAYLVVHADGGPASGLPAQGSIARTDPGQVDYPGDSLLRDPITLEGPVAIPDAVPATTVTRTCRTERTSRNVLSVACEGPDPEAACSGTLSIRPPVAP